MRVRLFRNVFFRGMGIKPVKPWRLADMAGMAERRFQTPPLIHR